MRRLWRALEEGAERSAGSDARADIGGLSAGSDARADIRGSTAGSDARAEIGGSSAGSDARAAGGASVETVTDQETLWMSRPSMVSP